MAWFGFAWSCFWAIFTQPFFARRSGGLVVLWCKSDVRVRWWLMLDFGRIDPYFANLQLQLFHTILLYFPTLPLVPSKPTVDAHYKPKSCSHRADTEERTNKLAGDNRGYHQVQLLNLECTFDISISDLAATKCAWQPIKTSHHPHLNWMEKGWKERVIVWEVAWLRLLLIV